MTGFIQRYVTDTNIYKNKKDKEKRNSMTFILNFERLNHTNEECLPKKI